MSAMFKWEEKSDVPLILYAAASQDLDYFVGKMDSLWSAIGHQTTRTEKSFFVTGIPLGIFRTADEAMQACHQHFESNDNGKG